MGNSNHRKTSSKTDIKHTHTHTPQLKLQRKVDENIIVKTMEGFAQTKPERNDYLWNILHSLPSQGTHASDQNDVICNRLQ